ncbi:nucleotidyltransferase family protein [Brevibacterium samyangense]|uniref:Polymerase nucleotidyl transferase domain-containing protein n=1 Tax=Brevibacterium samyangense TaxID=366888 RepID=A0ABN2TJL7_9MICO
MSESGGPPSHALREHANEVRAILAAVGARNPRVFGSTARGEDTASSDIDLLVDMDPGADAFSLAGARRLLKDLLGYEVDLVNAGSIPSRKRKMLDESVGLGTFAVGSKAPDCRSVGRGVVPGRDLINCAVRDDSTAVPRPGSHS